MKLILEDQYGEWLRQQLSAMGISQNFVIRETGVCKAALQNLFSQRM